MPVLDRPTHLKKSTKMIPKFYFLLVLFWPIPCYNSRTAAIFWQKWNHKRISNLMLFWSPFDLLLIPFWHHLYYFYMWKTISRAQKVNKKSRGFKSYGTKTLINGPIKKKYIKSERLSLSGPFKSQFISIMFLFMLYIHVLVHVWGGGGSQM